MIERKYVPCRSALSRSSLPGLRYTFNPYVGCRHGCLYCYVPDVLRRCLSAAGWGEYAYVKERILERLDSDLRRNPPGIVGVSTATDPYQPIEEELGLTRGALIAMGEAGFSASIQTKSSLVARDLDVIKRHNFELGMTITSMDDRFQRKFEPGASPPAERAKTLRIAFSKGIKTWIFYGPIIPDHNDSREDMGAILDLAEGTRSSILYDRLNLKPLMKVRLRGVLSPEEIQNLHGRDFTRTYGLIQSLSIERSVNARPAF